MKTALFIYPPLKGHLNPCIKLANELKSNNVQIYFVGNISVKEFSRENNYKFYLIESVPFLNGDDLSSNWAMSILDQSENHYAAITHPLFSISIDEYVCSRTSSKSFKQRLFYKCQNHSKAHFVE